MVKQFLVEYFGDDLNVNQLGSNAKRMGAMLIRDCVVDRIARLLAISKAQFAEAMSKHSRANSSRCSARTAVQANSASNRNSSNTIESQPRDIDIISRSQPQYSAVQQSDPATPPQQQPRKQQREKPVVPAPQQMYRFPQIPELPAGAFQCTTQSVPQIDVIEQPHGRLSSSSHAQPSQLVDHDTDHTYSNGHESSSVSNTNTNSNAHLSPRTQSTSSLYEQQIPQMPPIVPYSAVTATATDVNTSTTATNIVAILLV